MQLGHCETVSTAVPQIGFGVRTGHDPANGMFNTTNFPNASNDDLNNARALYALLTGRVTSSTARRAWTRHQPVRLPRPHDRTA